MISSGRQTSKKTRLGCFASGQPQAPHFPPGFLWGAATWNNKVEGDNRWSDWWEYEQTGRLPHKSGVACRHYEMYEQDFDLARSMGTQRSPFLENRMESHTNLSRENGIGRL